MLKDEPFQNKWKIQTVKCKFYYPSKGFLKCCKNDRVLKEHRRIITVLVLTEVTLDGTSS